MADNTNIDEILKSIDALLKEGGAENGSDQDVGDQSSKRQATNDDEVSDLEMPDASVSIQNEEDEADVLGVETIEDESAEHQETNEAETGDQTSENIQHEDASVVDTTAGQALEQGREVKRIVLSEAMLVRDTPDLLLAFADAEDTTEEVQAGSVLTDESSPEHVDEDESDASWEPAPSALLPDVEIQAQAGQEEVEDEAVADAPALDTGRLIEQITAEISGRLQQQLPGMVAGMVAEAMEKNLVAHAAPGDKSTDDRQN